MACDVSSVAMFFYVINVNVIKNIIMLILRERLNMLSSMVDNETLNAMVDYQVEMIMMMVILMMFMRILIIIMIMI